MKQFLEIIRILRFTIKTAIVPSKTLFSLSVVLCELDFFFEKILKEKQSPALLYCPSQEIQLRDF